MTRRFLAFVLAFLMLFSAMPLEALAASMPEETVPSDGLVVTTVEETTAPTETTEETEATSEPETQPAETEPVVVLETEPVVETTVAEEVIPETTVVEEVIPETTVAEKVIPETTVAEEIIPETTVAEEVIPETTVAEEVIPETTVAEEVIPETTVAEETVPETTVAEETVPETTVAEETVPETTAAEETESEETEEEVEEEVEAEDVITNEVGMARGTDLGWDYAIIEASYNQWGNFNGYTISDPAGTSDHLGNYVTVTINGTNVAEYNNSTSNIVSGALSSSTTGTVTVTVNTYGYYIAEMILCCGDRSGTPNPFNCNTKSTSDAYTFPVTGTPTSHTANLADIYDVANHGSNDDDYFIMVELARIPSTVYVGYDSGMAGTHDIAAVPVVETGAIGGSLYQVGDYKTWAYSTTGLTAAPNHTALGISPEAEAEANALGYSFAGWHLEYYTSYTEATNAFSGEMTVGGTNLSQGTNVELELNAKLIAIWQPLIQIELEKIWTVDSHPDSVTVNVLRNGNPSGITVTLNAANNWKAAVNAPSVDENGNPITYTVAEEVPEGFSCSIASVTPSSSEYEYSFQLTNTPVMNDQAGSVIISGQKIWEDADNADSTRPGSIVVNLYADGVKIASQTVTGPDWKYSFDVSNVENAADVVFTVGEEAVANYTLSNVVHPDVQFVNPTTSGGWEEISPCSTLSYQNTASGKTVVAAKMISDGTVVIWSVDALAQFERDLIIASLEAGANGLDTPNQYVFLSGEGASSEYGITVNSSQLLFGATSNWSMFWKGIYSRGSSSTTASSLTNTLTNASIKVHKVWADDDNRDGIRPDSVTVQLYKLVNGVETAVGEAVTLTEATSWTKQWDSLPMYEGGVKIDYNVKEVNVPSGYTVTYEEDTDHTSVINTHVPAVIDIPVEKVWDDQNNRDDMQPVSITVTLYANGEVNDTLELNASNSWKGVFEDKYVKANGTDITYTVAETSVPGGYTVSVTGDKTNGFVVTNTHTPVLINVPVTKVWEDGNDQDGLRPDDIQVELYADGVATGKTLTLEYTGNWEGSFTDLEKYRAGAVGQEIVYTVKEVAVPEGYTVSYNGTTITNKHVPETANLNVKKVWDDFDDNDGKRADAVIITLYANGHPLQKTDDQGNPVVDAEGNPVYETVTLDASNNWQAVWENMPRYQNGQRISYTIVETGHIDDGVVTDKAPEGYTVTHSYDTSNTKEPVGIVTNQYTPETIGLNVQKVWDDADNQDGIRPASVTVELYYKNSAEGEWIASGKTAVLSPANEWDADFTGLPKYHDGFEIQYNVVEESVDGYTTAYALDTKTYVVTVTNTHVPAQTSVSVSKIWDDNNDQDGLRPDAIVVTLFADGEPLQKKNADGTLMVDASGNPVYYTATLTQIDINTWTSGTFTGLDKFFHGEQIVYTVVETGYIKNGITYDGVPDGYSVSAPVASNGAIAVTNTHVPYTTEVSFFKIWNDSNDQDGIRPDSVTVTLYANGTAVDTMEVDAGDNWQGTFKDLPKYEGGKEIVYTVGEADSDVPAGYTAKVEGTTITNTHEAEKTQISVTKIWDDANNQDGLRQAVTITLYANGAQVLDDNGAPVTLTLSDANSWQGTFRDLDKYAGGTAITYTVMESALPGYTAYDSNGNRVTVFAVTNGTVSITNKHIPETTSVSVTKVWDDHDNQDGKRPATVTIDLLADGVVINSKTVSNAVSWKATFTNLPKYRDEGTAIVYTVQEQVVPNGYTAAISGAAVEGYTITNSKDLEKTNIPVSKVWDDAGNQDGKRPASIQVALYADNAATGDSLTLDASNNWSGSFNDLTKYRAGEVGTEIVYTVEEVQVPEGYTAKVEGTTITNTHIPETIDIPVAKLWDDGDNQDNIRPAKITVTVYNGTTAVQTIDLTAANSWSGIFADLPKYENGNEIVYTVGEAAITGYDMVDETGNVITSAAVVEGKVTLTNRHVPEETSLTVYKLWDDDDDNDKVRPETISVVLYADGEPVLNADQTPYTIVVSAENGWQTTVTGLPKKDAGEDIRYVVYENIITDAAGNDLGYAPNYVRQVDETNNVTEITITNKRDTTKTNKTVQKVWDDNHNQDGKRPASVTVQLYANGTPVVSYEDSKGNTISGKQVLTENTSWTYQWLDLEWLKDGTPITYTVAEEPVAEYTVTYSEDSFGRIVVKNTHIPETVDVPVTKIWDDDDNRDGARPASIQVILYADGEVEKTAAVTADADGNWKHTFTDLPKYAAGKEISYTIGEAEVKNYTTSIDGNEITNTHIPETIDIPVVKSWDDADNQDGKRPSSVVVSLMDGEKVVDTMTITAADNWTGEFTDLPKYRTGAVGEQIVYTLTEAEITGYELVGGTTASMTGGSFAITNRHIPETVSVTATKLWNDADNKDGKRPDSITLHLLRDGQHTGEAKTVTPDADGSWTVTWTGLPKYAPGQVGAQITYTVVEGTLRDKDGNPYSVENTQTTTGDHTEVTITNTRDSDKTSVTVEKIWDDAYDQDGLRPVSIRVELYADGVATGKTLELTQETGWIGIFRNLELNRAGTSAQPIEYSVVEIGYTDKTVVYHTGIVYGEGSVSYGTDTETGALTITNKYIPETTEVKVTKAWVDADDQDGIRPDSVTVELYANGVATGKKQTITPDADGNWTAVFSGLDKNQNGKPITYTVVEEKVPGYTDTYSRPVVADGVTSITVSNTHIPDVVSIPVIKEWDDAHNQDGKRPVSITVTLYKQVGEGAAQSTGETLTLTAADNWQGVFQNLPVNEAGKPIVYSILEDAIAEYNDGQQITVQVENGQIKIVNKHEPETANLNVQKVWDDFDDNDGKRTDAVIITLYVNGQPLQKTDDQGKPVVDAEGNPVYETVILEESNNWKATWENMPRYHNGQRISYTVVETGYINDGIVSDGVPTGYTVTHSYDTTDTKNPVATVTNKYTPETTGLNVQKVWADDDNRHGLRPASITVELYYKASADGQWVASGKTAVMNAENEWDADFVSLPKYHDQFEIVYNAVEVGYTDQEGNYHDGLVYGEGSASYSPVSEAGVVTITNTHEAGRVSVMVTKEWDDANDQDGIRPESIQVTLYANGIRSTSKDPAATVTLSEENGWTHTWENLYEYYKGRKIDYTVVEDTVADGYEVSTSVSTVAEAVDGKQKTTVEVTLTNKHTPEVTSIPVVKLWDDANDQDGMRPAEIKVTLYANGQPYMTAQNTTYMLTLTAANNWEDVFENLPKFEAGKPVQYSIVEAVIEGYNVDPESKEEQALTVLAKDGKIEITNTHETEKTTLKAIKVWNDANDQDGKRPEKITLHLLADGVHMGEDYKAELTAENDWTYEWTGLDKFKAGKEIQYTVYEEPITFNTAQPEAEQEGSSAAAQSVNGYTASYHRDSKTQITVTNTYTPETTEVTVMKVWDDDNNRDALRSESITAELFANDESTGKTLVLNEENDWAGTWKDLPKYANKGQKVVYTVKEADGPKEYTCTVTQDTETENLFHITNSYTPETTGVSVIKNWDDENDNDGKRPDGIIVQLYADGVAVEGARVILNADNQWQYVWNSTEEMPLFVFQNGKLISYYVVETGYVIDGVEYAGMPEGYQGSAVKNGEYTVSITNTRATEKLSVQVLKQWQDNEDNDGFRPDQVEVTLLKNGQKVETVTLNEENEWQYTWTDLYKYAAGEEVEYTVEEAAVNGYTASYSYEKNETTKQIIATVTNTHEAETVSVKVVKEWDDRDDNDGIRPSAIKVTLLQDGETVETVTLNEKNGWEYTWTDLAKYEDGEKIEYTVKEKAVEGYEAEYAYETSTDGKQITATITNTHEAEKVSLTVVKEWDDGDDNDGARPAKIRVTLLRNGKKLKTVTLNEKNDWKHTWKGLDKFVDGEAAEYTVKEKKVSGYTTSYSYSQSEDGKKITATITNSYTIEGKWYAVEKIWKDNKNAEGLRPSSVTVQLYKNGEAYGNKIVLSAANNWKSPKYLPVYEDGAKIKWTIKELEIPRYYTASYDQSTMTVTNTIQSKEVPKTGDQNNLWMWGLMLGVCGIGAVSVLFYDKKRKKNA